MKLLRDCTVRIDTPSRGTGFFAAPGLILSCAHVVKDASVDKPITLIWQGATYTARALKIIPAPEAAIVQDPYPYPDIALLQVDFIEHSCVYLHTGIDLLQQMASYGYPRTDSLDDFLPAGQSAVFTCESFGYITPQQPFIKFKEGQVEAGLSGAPLLNLNTGGVCGMVKRTRDRFSALGGYGIPTATIFEHLPELVDQQQQYHRRNVSWGALLSPEQRRLLDWLGPSREPNDLPPNTWKACGPPTEFVRALAIDPHQPDLLYAGMNNAHGLYRSLDGGATWAASNEGLTNLDIKCIVPSYHDEKVYVGTDRGLFVSINQGKTWHQGHERYRAADVRSIALSPHDPGVFICGTGKRGGASMSAGTIAAAGSHRSSNVDVGHFHISLDSGHTWITLNIDSVNSAVISPIDSSVIFLGTGDDGLYRSLDGGEQFAPVESLKAKNIQCVAVSPQDIQLVLVGTIFQGLYISYDAGESWSHVEASGNEQIGVIAFSPVNPQHILVATRGGMLESRDEGASWSAANNNLVHRWAMALDIKRDGTAYVGTSGGGVYKRAPGRISWQETNAGFASLVSGLSVLVANDRLVFAGTLIGLYRTTNGGNTWRLMAYFDSGSRDNPEPVWSLAASDESNQQVRTVVNYSGLHMSTDSGSSWDRPATASVQVMLLGTSGGRLYRSVDAGTSWQRVAEFGGDQVWALDVDQQQPYRIVAGVNNGGVFWSDDAGATWRPINDGLDDLRITSVLISRRSGRKLFAGAGGGKLYGSDDGTTWRQLEVELPPKAIFSIVESEQLAGRMYLATDGAGVYRSDDNGTTWLPINNGLGSQRVLALVESRETASKVYAGTWNGVYRSRDGGESWEEFNAGLPANPHAVNRLVCSPTSPHLLYAGMREGLFKVLLHD